jgi:hypothetical protein
VSVRLWTFQPVVRIAELERTGRLRGSWGWVSPGFVTRSYEAMIAAMARAGIDTDGRPPVWAWGGRCGVTLADAESLLGSYGLRQGCATIEFEAPAARCLASDYGAWNDFQFALHSGEEAPSAWDVPTPVEEELVQVCLPELRREWVREVRALPRRLTGPDDRLHPA